MLEIINYNRYKFIFILVNFLILILFFYYANKNIQNASKNLLLDFPAFYIAGKVSLEGKSPYQKENIIRISEELEVPYTEYRSFLYPPQSLLVFRYLAKLDLYNSQKLITILKEFSLLLSVFILALINYKNSNFNSTVNPYFLFHFNIFIGLLLSTFFWPVKNDIFNGQVNIFIFFLLVLSYYFSEKVPFITGICISLSFLIKITPFFIVSFFILRSKFRLNIFISMVLTSVIISLISLYTNGLETHLDFIINLFFNTKENYIPILGWPYSIAHNQSITGLFNRLFVNDYLDEYFGTTPIYQNQFLGRVLIYGSIIYVIYKTITSCLSRYIIEYFQISKLKYVPESNNDLLYGLIICSTLLISPVTWVHHMVALIFPIMILFNYLLKYSSRHILNLKILIFFLSSLIFLLISHLYPLNRIFILGIFFSYIHLFSNLSIFFICLYFIMNEAKKDRIAYE